MSKAKNAEAKTAEVETPAVEPEAPQTETAEETPEVAAEAPVESPVIDAVDSGEVGEAPEASEAASPSEFEEEEPDDGEVKPTATAPDVRGVDVAQILANAGDVQVRNAGTENLEEFDGYKVGQPAPATKWLDKGRVKVLDTPTFTDGVGSVLVQKGEVVRQSVVDQLRRGTEK